MKYIKWLMEHVYRLVGSTKFFYIVVGVLVIEALWFALTTKYPMAFDENYHFGIIQIYAHQWSPFIAQNPPNTGAYGDITRYDSYLYHYLMSFPYRLIAVFFHQQIIQIIMLRCLNVGLFVMGLFLFRRLFQSLHLSARMINFSLLMLVLIPVVPFLAATINYDNLLFIVVPTITLLTLRCSQALTRGTLPAYNLIWFLCVGCLGSLVKYAFLPIFLACLLYLVIVYLSTRPRPRLFKSFVSSWKRLSVWLRLSLAVSLAISFGLVVERYGINLAIYHSIEPDCAKIQTIDNCMQYGPWGRNYSIKQTISPSTPLSPPAWFFIPAWFGRLVYRLYFAINYDYTNYEPLPIPITVASIVGGLGLVLCLFFWRSILKINRHLLLLMIISFFYTVSLFYVNLSDYLQYKTMLAINGRYLVVILPLLFIWAGLAYYFCIKKIFKAQARTFMSLYATVVVLLVLQGGGALTQVVRSDPSWYFDSSPVQKSSHALKKIVSPLVIGAKKR